MVGLLLIGLTVLPVFRLLDSAFTGLAGEYVVEQLATATSLIWSVTLLALIPFVLALRLGADLPLGRWLGAAGGRLARVPVGLFAAAIAAVGALLAAWFGLVVLEGKPNLIDAMAQLVHARYLADGASAGPTWLAEFFVFPNTVLTEHGWVSQYPPGHVALLALGFRLGAVWLVGPVLLGAALWLTALIADRLLPERRLAVRVALAFLATSPFLIAHAGAYMNHTSAAAFAALAVWLVLRARDGSAGWALAAGAVASIAVATRPLSTFAIICAVGATAWGSMALEERRFGRFARLVAVAFAGALPLSLLQLWHNAHFFGSPTTFGYFAAYGPSHELGFGQDPWGNRYGLLEAVGYTSSDLTLLSSALFEAPLPLVAIVGLFLVLAKRLETGERIVLAWALAPVAANFFYWHHGVFMGPRMLNEAAPAWALLVAIAVDDLVRRVPAEIVLSGRRYAPRIAVVTALAVVLCASLAFMVPRRMISWGGAYFQSVRVEPPRPPEPAVVFVHGPWVSRVGSRLVASGMRLDSLETALRQNTTCAVQRYADARVQDSGTDGATASALPWLDFEPRADRLPPSVEISPANYIRFLASDTLGPHCVAQIRADARGVLELAPFLWQGTLPGGGPRGVMYARDLGPARNQALLARVPDRTPWVFAPRALDEPPALMPYEEGMRMLWGGDGT